MYSDERCCCGRMLMLQVLLLLHSAAHGQPFSAAERHELPRRRATDSAGRPCGHYERSFEWQGIARRYIAFVPPQLCTSDEGMAVAVFLHCFGCAFEQDFGWNGISCPCRSSWPLRFLHSSSTRSTLSGTGGTGGGSREIAGPGHICPVYLSCVMTAVGVGDADAAESNGFVLVRPLGTGSPHSWNAGACARPSLLSFSVAVLPLPRRCPLPRHPRANLSQWRKGVPAILMTRPDIQVSAVGRPLPHERTTSDS